MLSKMESTNDNGASDARDSVTEAPNAIVVTAQQESPTGKQARQTPTELSNLEMEDLLDGGKLPALNILLWSAPAKFNYHTMMRTLIPMAFGSIDQAHLRPDALGCTTRELEAVVGALIEGRFLSPQHSRRTQAEVGHSLGEALRDNGVIFKMRANESDVSSHRFGRFMQQEYL